MTAPAWRSSLTTVASRRAPASASASEPAVVCWASPVAMLSFTRIGMPSSGRRAFALRASSLVATTSASGLISRTALSCGPARS
jgi:hypothetical protein